MKHLKVTALLLLLVQAFHLALLQESTDSPGRTIDKSWLRQKPQNTANSENAASPGEEGEYSLGRTIDPSWLRQKPQNTVSGENAASPGEEGQSPQGTDAPQFMNDVGDGVASGYMALNSDVEKNIFRQEDSENDMSEGSNIVMRTPSPVSENGTNKQLEMLNATFPPTTTTTVSSNSSQTNMTEAEEELNSTVTTADNSTSFPVFSNDTDLHLTTLAPEKNATEGSTTPDADKGLTNHSGPTSTTTLNTAAAPETNEASTTSSSTTVLPSETSDMSTVTFTTLLQSTPERANKTGKGASSSGKDLESDLYRSKRNVAWVAVLGTAAAMACVGLVVYIILKKKHQKGFTHRKLVEEYPSDPVLRLDNSEPLDLNFGGSAYYNPGLQGDSIQMTNFPGHR